MATGAAYPVDSCRARLRMDEATGRFTGTVAELDANPEARAKYLEV